MPIKIPMKINKGTYIGLLLAALVCVLVYQVGLPGPFLFDDSVHITKNKQVHIEDLSLDSLSRAWNSSLSPPPANRPLAQLTFGLNHVFGDLSTQGFKATNLAIHLINGWLLFLLTSSLLRAHSMARDLCLCWQRIDWIALTVAAIWLLHPLNLSTVLYVVQRMTELSALFVLLGLWLYVSGRLAIAEGRSGLGRILLAFPVAALGILAKENAVLFPVLLLIIEFTLLRGLTRGAYPKAGLGILILGAALPVLAGFAYLVAHPELYAYAGRQFTLEERLLTQARALWFYLHMFVTPMLQDLGLFHDDFPISKSWLSPISTAPAVVAWVVLIVGSFAYAQRLPVLAFGVLFYLGAHSLESSIIPLEMVFEHRNYLPLYGPAFVLAYFLINPPSTVRARRFLPILAITLICVYTFLTHMRATDWSSSQALTLSEVAHHPDSKRANFMAAQHFMRYLDHAQYSEKAYAAARQHFEKVAALDPGNPDALFGLIVLHLHTQQQPEKVWIDKLANELANKTVDATRFTTAQFSYLVRWHLGQNYPLAPADVARLFDAIAQNPRLGKPGRAGILAARAVYVDRVLGQPEQALRYAKHSVEYWPTRWHYRKRLAQLMMRLQLWDEAIATLEKGIALSLPQNQLTEAEHLLMAAHRKELGQLD